MARVRHALAGMGVVALVAAAAIIPPEETLASWSDPESAAGTFSAIQLQAPASASCTTVNLLILRQGARISWTAPPGGLPAGARYELLVTNVTANPNITNSMTTTDTTFTLEDGLLGGGLLFGLLSGNASLRFQVRTVLLAGSEVTWHSASTPATPLTGAYTGGLLSGNFTC